MIKIIQPAQIETAIKNDIMAVRIPKALQPGADAGDWSFFIDLTQVKRKTLDLKALRNDRSFRRYFYITDGLNEFCQSLAKMGFRGGEDFYEKMDRYQQENKITIINREDFDPEKLIYFSNEDHLVYSFRRDTPRTRAYYIDYIGGVDNESYDLELAEDILRKNPWVSEIEKVDIPYYNCEKGRNKAIEFIAHLPQEEYDKLVRYFRDEKKDQYWSVRLKDCFASSYQLEPFDILGLKAALKEKR